MDEGNNSVSVHAVHTVPPEPSTSRATVEDGLARRPVAAIPDRFPDVAEKYGREWPAISGVLLPLNNMSSLTMILHLRMKGCFQLTGIGDSNLVRFEPETPW